MPARQPRIRATVEAALKASPGLEWQRELALALASDLDIKANASNAAQLRALMDELGAAKGNAVKDVSDDLATKRAARRSASG